MQLLRDVQHMVDELPLANEQIEHCDGLGHQIPASTTLQRLFHEEHSQTFRELLQQDSNIMPQMQWKLMTSQMR